MNYSYTQISQYLSCPRRYRHRYLDGWQEKDARPAMLFGRAFEQAVAALFRREDPAAVLCEQWSLCKDMGLTYSGNDTWDRMLQQGIQLLERSLTSMPLVNSTARAAFWNGRPAPRDMQKNRPAFPHWIRSWFAIRG